MQSDQQFHPGKAGFPISGDVGGGFTYNGPFAPALGATLPPDTNHLRPFHGVEFQPCKVCPKSFIIFDQTDDRSRIMYHPALTHKFECPNADVGATFVHNKWRRKDGYSEGKESSYSFKEDTKDIDALLSFEEEDHEEDQEEVSTARTHGSLGSTSPDTCSSYGLKHSKLRFSSTQKLASGYDSNGSSSSNSERKRRRMKEMVKAMRGIVPGVEEMSTAAVLDEAVRYLKTLKVEVKKLGIGTFNN